MVRKPIEEQAVRISTTLYGDALDILNRAKRIWGTPLTSVALTRILREWWAFRGETMENDPWLVNKNGK